jgi:type II secretory pathway pseudopilin PulG
MYRRAVIEHTENQRKEAGFTLIEVMFAVVFLSIGLLGIAAMQDIALSRNIDGRRVTVATNLAAEMLERIRFNAIGNSKALPAGTYLYHNIIACTPTAPAVTCPFTVVNPCPTLFANCTGPTPGNTTSVAPGAATALGDYNQWRAALAAVDSNNVRLLPGAIGTVQAVAVDPLNAVGPTSLEQVRVTVQVQWASGIRTPTVTMNSMVAPL